MKILPSDIPGAFIRSIRHRDKPDYVALFTLYAVPTALAVWTWKTSLHVLQANQAAILTAFSLFAGLLSNVLALNAAGKTTARTRRQRAYAHAHISYAVLIALTGVALAVAAPSFPGLAGRVLATTLTFIAIHFLFCTMVVVRGMYSLIDCDLHESE